MIVTIKPKAPGRWNVYRSVGLSSAEKVGRVVRLSGLGAAKTFFFDKHDRRHELGSLPKAWPQQIKRYLEQDNS